MSDRKSAKTRYKPAPASSPDSADKTVVEPRQNEAQPAAEDVDKTRIAPQRNQATPTAETVDKTRIAPPRNKTMPAAEAGDKTGIEPRHKQTASAVDVTRYKPRSTAPNENTRVAPPRQAVARQVATPAGLQVLKNRFVLEEVLGTGGMGIVYKAKDLLMEEAQDRDPYVAIKVLSEEFKTHPEAFISLQRESRKSQRIAHPNIVNVYDFDRDDDTVFMTMEFLDGEPLDDLISRYRSTGLPTDEAWEIIRAMASALSHAHAEKIIHSDFKPGNVFVTRKGLTKVFDFGIARAVARVEHLEDNPQDQTLFDAGNLGALTPAYASLEMLEGEEPDVRDDVYALGCVAYEMFTGKHPYDRLPADEAERQGLKPQRITHIRSAQWRAIEKAIAFRRENRMGSVDEFSAQILPSHKSRNLLLAGVLMMLVAGGGTYYQLQQDKGQPEFSEFDIRNEIELQVRIDFLKKDVEELINDPRFSDPWQESLLQATKNLSLLTQGKDPWVRRQKAVIYELYLQQIRAEITRQRFAIATSLIGYAGNYNTDEAELTALLNSIELERKKQQVLEQRLAADKKKKLQQQQAEKLSQQATQAKRESELVRQQTQTRQVKQQFDVALDNVKNQLKCQGSLNMGNIETAIRKLKQLDRARYRAIENGIIEALATCIVQIGEAFPERAEAAKKHGLRIFSSSILAEINIRSRDPCDLSLAGLGARGKRAVCKDRLKDKTPGPDMVVIPGSSKIGAFAIGKYEASVAEINHYCRLAKTCKPLAQNEQLPVSNVPIKLVRSYLKWLSQQTGQTYRLPSNDEWVHAARSRSKSLDPNRNCELNTRGFKKGEELVKFTIGKQNGWGLVNYVGNVQEWVYHTGQRLHAVGGSFQEPMKTCTISAGSAHDGSADKLTGFRVLREIEG